MLRGGYRVARRGIYHYYPAAGCRVNINIINTNAGTRDYLERNAEKLDSPDFHEKSGQFVELMSLFLYYLYRRMAKEAEHGRQKDPTA